MAYTIFFCGFLFFPSSKSHNNFFYITLLLPSLIILRYLFRTFLKNTTFKLIFSYLAYLVLTNFWGVNVTLENVAEQVKHTFYILAFITASIVVEAYYPEKRDRLLPLMAGIAAIAFLVSTLWWYQTHSFPTERLFDIPGRLDNPIFAGCIAGMACLVLIDILQQQARAGFRLTAGIAFAIHLMFIVLSQSRTALAAMIPALLVLLIPQYRRHRRLLIITGAILITMGFILQDALIAGFNRGSFRLEIWQATLEKAIPHLWWGQGYFCDTFALHIEELNYDAPHAHNVFIATLRDGGIIGLLLLIGAIGAAGWCACRQALASKRYLNLSLVTFGVLALSFDNDRLVANPEELWLFFWYPLGRIMAQDLVGKGILKKPHYPDPITFNATTRMT
jgi:O-antigen ligase